MNELNEWIYHVHWSPTSVARVGKTKINKNGQQNSPIDREVTPMNYPWNESVLKIIHHKHNMTNATNDINIK